MRPHFPQQFPGGMQGLPFIQIPPFDENEFRSIPATDIDQKKQFIGNHIYPSIQANVGENFAGKITGMLLDEKAVNIDNLLFDPAYLNGKVNEAHTLLVQT